MAKITPPPFGEISPEDLLGHLNEVERKNAPAKLYFAGHPEILRDRVRVAVVGSRDASNEGLRRASRIATALAGKGVVVVSGLARGVDAAAHNAAIRADGATVAVLGTPIDEVYPAEHAELQKLIGERFLVVTQFPPGQGTRKWNFPLRNRTMALLCHASIIVEAGDSSGTLSQGWEALRLGRPLFIMRSVAERSSLKWPAEMMRYGAEVLSEPDEVLEYLPNEGGGIFAGAAF
jgi:DNA processing protein